MNEQAAATRGRCFGEPGPGSHDEAELDASDTIGVRPDFKISMRNEKTRMPREEKEKIRFAIGTEPGEETK